MNSSSTIAFSIISRRSSSMSIMISSFSSSSLFIVEICTDIASISFFAFSYFVREPSFVRKFCFILNSMHISLITWSLCSSPDLTVELHLWASINFSISFTSFETAISANSYSYAFISSKPKICCFTALLCLTSFI